MPKLRTPSRTDAPSKIPVLISYAYLRRMPEKDLEKLAKSPHIELLIDSGAFTAFYTKKPIRIEDYISWLKTWRKYFFAYFTLDVIQKPKESWRNYQRLLEEGLTPIPIHTWGDSEKRFHEYYKHSDIVGFPSVRHRREHPAIQLHCIKTKMEWAAGRKVHLLGVGRPSTIYHFRPYSGDSTTWMDGCRYGLCYLYLGRGKLVTMDRKAAPTRLRDPRVRKALRTAGFTQEDVLNPKSWNVKGANTARAFRERLLSGMSVWSWVRFVQEAKQQLRVRVFLATGVTKSHLGALLRTAREIARVRGI
jgi:hypothetical protein